MSFYAQAVPVRVAGFNPKASYIVQITQGIFSIRVIPCHGYENKPYSKDYWCYYRNLEEFLQSWQVEVV